MHIKSDVLVNCSVLGLKKGVETKYYRLTKQVRINNNEFVKCK